MGRVRPEDIRKYGLIMAYCIAARQGTYWCWLFKDTHPWTIPLSKYSIHPAVRIYVRLAMAVR